MSGRGQALRGNRYGIDGHSHVVAGNWLDWPVVVSQGSSTNISKTITYAKYQVIDLLVIAQASITLTSPGTTNNPILLSLPVTAAISGLVVGNGGYADYSTQASPLIVVPTAIVLNSTAALGMMRSDAPTSGMVGTDPIIPAGTNDRITLTMVYPRAE